MADIAQTIKSTTGINTVQAQANSIPGSVTTVVPPTTFVFWAGFDGTNNTESNPAYSGDAQSTAVGAMYRQILMKITGLPAHFYFFDDLRWQHNS